MKKIISLLLFLSCLVCTSEMDKSSNITGENKAAVEATLTEATMAKYLQVFEALKSQIPNTLELLNENESDTAPQTELNTLTNIVQNNGMNYNDFVAINAKIGTIYSISEANMDTYQDIADMNTGAMDDMGKAIQEMIDDPDIPEHEKDKLRASLRDVEQGKGQLDNMFEQNKEKAANMYKKIQKKLGKIATTQEVQLVAKYQQELKIAYDGIARPRIEGSL